MSTGPLHRTLRRLAVAVLAGLVLPVSAALAEGPLPGTEGEKESEAKKIARRLTKEFRENEDELQKLARGERGDPKGVDIDAPKEPERAEEGEAQVEKQLKECEENGREIIKAIDELLGLT